MMEEKKVKVAVVVDDMPVERLSVRQQLVKQEYTVFLAKNGLEALDNLHTYGKVDLFVIDYEMPGMDGVETILGLRRNLDHCNVLIIGRTSQPHLMKGNVEELLRKEALSVDNLYFVLKPNEVNVAQCLAAPRQTVEELALAVSDYYKIQLSKTVAAMECLSVRASSETSKSASREKSPLISRTPTPT